MDHKAAHEQNTEFDFDYWMKLFQDNPELFEVQRKLLIDDCIKQAPEEMQRRLTGLQWRVDSEIMLSKNPMDGCIKVYEMMMDSIYESGGLLDALNMVDSVKVEQKENVVNLNTRSKFEK